MSVATRYINFADLGLSSVALSFGFCLVAIASERARRLSTSVAVGPI